MARETKSVTALVFGLLVFALVIVLTARAVADDTQRLGAIYSQHQANAEYIRRKLDAERQIRQEQFDRFVNIHGYTPETRGYKFK